MLTAPSRAGLALKAKLFRGFSDPSRLSMLEALRGGPLSVGEIATATALSQSNVSNHLSCLLDCGLVSREQQGRFVYYQLSDPRVALLLGMVDEVLADVAQGVYECTRYAVPTSTRTGPMSDTAELTTIEVPIAGMDCAGCTRSVQQALTALPGVASADVLLASEKAIIRLDPRLVDLPAIKHGGRSRRLPCPGNDGQSDSGATRAGERGFTRAVFGCWGSSLARSSSSSSSASGRVCSRTSPSACPSRSGVAIVLAFGYPVFRNVVQATLRRQVISHTVMTIGVLAALAVGQWATAAVVVFFMRVGDYAEHFTTERAGARSRT